MQEDCHKFQASQSCIARHFLENKTNNIRKYKGKDGREQLHFTKNLEEAHGLFTVDTTIHHTGYLH